VRERNRDHGRVERRKDRGQRDGGDECTLL
jgi:hypothetical protein